MTTTRADSDRGRTSEQDRAARELWSELIRLTGAVRSSLEAYLGDHAGLTPEEADLLVLLSEAPEQRLRMADVSAALRLSKSGVTRLVDRLADRDLVVRAACPEDRRVTYAGLTDGGREAAASAGPVLAAGLTGSLAARLSPEEISALTAALRRIAPDLATGA